MAQQTAVEWLVDQVEDFIGLIPIDIIQQAKEKERQEIIQFATDWYNFNVRSTAPTGVEQYYNETYGK